MPNIAPIVGGGRHGYRWRGAAIDTAVIAGWNSQSLGGHHGRSTMIKISTSTVRNGRVRPGATVVVADAREAGVIAAALGRAYRCTAVVTSTNDAPTVVSASVKRPRSRLALWISVFFSRS